MTRIYTTTTISRPIEEVFAYVSTPAHWPAWHPSSLGVSGATDHSLAVGEQVTEEFSVAGHTGRALWTVRERVEPVRWVIDGVIEGRGSGGTVAYMLIPRGQTTFFERAFIYPTPSLLFKLILVSSRSLSFADALRPPVKARRGADQVGPGLQRDACRAAWASSMSSIVAKWRLASAVLVSGQRCSAGCSSGE